MTIYTDANTVGNKTTPSGVDVIHYRNADLATIESVTTLSGLEIGFDGATIETFTSLIGSYTAETLTIATRDYNFDPWTIRYIHDPSFPIAGSVGMFDDDNGEL